MALRAHISASLTTMDLKIIMNRSFLLTVLKFSLNVQLLLLQLFVFNFIYLLRVGYHLLLFFVMLSGCVCVFTEMHNVFFKFQ